MSGWHSLSGYLQYKSGSALGRLMTRKKVWCVLEESQCQLRYYKQEDDVHHRRDPAGRIDINGAAISLDLEHQNQFVVLSEGKEHFFTAENHESMMIWLLGLQAKREIHIRKQTMTEDVEGENDSEQRTRSKSDLTLWQRPSLFINQDQPPASPSSSQTSFSLGREFQWDKYEYHKWGESLDSGLSITKRGRFGPSTTVGLARRASATMYPESSSCESDDVFDEDARRNSRRQISGHRKLRSTQSMMAMSQAFIPRASRDMVTENVDVTSSRSTSSDSAIDKGEGTPLELTSRLTDLEKELISTKCELAKVMNRQTCYRELLLQRDDTIKDLENKMEHTPPTSNKTDKGDKKSRPSVKTTKAEKEFHEKIRVLQNQNRFLNEEVKKLARIRLQEHGKYQEQNLKLLSLEADIEKWKVDYVTLIQSSIRFPAGEEGVEEIELCLYGGDTHQKRVQTLLDEARKINPRLPTFESLLNQEVHVDCYGFKHVYANTSLLLHYLCTELTHHYLLQAGVYEEHQKHWTCFMRQHGKAPMKNRKDLKRLCRGGIPDRFRKQVWRHLVHDMVQDVITEKGPHYYRNLCNILPESPLAACYRKQISLDLMRTMPSNINFSSTGSKGIMNLQDVLLSFCVHNPTIGYCQGMNFIVGMALLFLDPPDAFWALVAIAERYFSPHYFDHSLIGAQADQQVLKDMLKEKLPALYQHLEDIDIELSTITLNWFLAIFFDGLPFQTLLRVWDCFLLEGPKVLFRFSLSILQLHERDIIQKTDTIGIMKHLKACAKLTYDVAGLVKLAFEGLKPFPKRRDILSKQTCYLNALKEKHKKKELQRLAFAEREQMYMNMEAEAGIFMGIECATAMDGERVWLCYGDQHIGKISCVDCEQGTMTDLAIKLDSRVMCMCAVGKNVLVLGTISWMLLAFNANTREQTWQMQLHDAILSVCCYDDVDSSTLRLFCGLADGTVAVLELQQGEDRMESSADVLYIPIGQAPVTCLMLLDDQVWCASGNSVAIVHARTLDSMDTFSVSVNPYDHILSLVQGDYGIWISLRGSSILELWDPQTLHCRMLYDTRTDRYPQLRKEDDTYFNRARITSILSNGNTVWVGTGEGNLIMYEVMESTQMKTPTDMMSSSFDTSLEVMDTTKLKSDSHELNVYDLEAKVSELYELGLNEDFEKRTENEEEDRRRRQSSTGHRNSLIDASDTPRILQLRRESREHILKDAVDTADIAALSQGTSEKRISIGEKVSDLPEDLGHRRWSDGKLNSLKDVTETSADFGQRRWSDGRLLNSIDTSTPDGHLGPRQGCGNSLRDIAEVEGGHGQRRGSFGKQSSLLDGAELSGDYRQRQGSFGKRNSLLDGAELSGDYRPRQGSFGKRNSLLDGAELSGDYRPRQGSFGKRNSLLDGAELSGDYRPRQGSFGKRNSLIDGAELSGDYRPRQGSFGKRNSLIDGAELSGDYRPRQGSFGKRNSLLDGAELSGDYRPRQGSFGKRNSLLDGAELSGDYRPRQGSFGKRNSLIDTAELSGDYRPRQGSFGKRNNLIDGAELSGDFRPRQGSFGRRGSFPDNSDAGSCQDDVFTTASKEDIIEGLLEEKLEEEAQRRQEHDPDMAGLSAEEVDKQVHELYMDQMEEQARRRSSSAVDLQSHIDAFNSQQRTKRKSCSELGYSRSNSIDNRRQSVSGQDIEDFAIELVEQTLEADARRNSYRAVEEEAEENGVNQQQLATDMRRLSYDGLLSLPDNYLLESSARCSLSETSSALDLYTSNSSVTPTALSGCSTPQISPSSNSPLTARKSPLRKHFSVWEDSCGDMGQDLEEHWNSEKNKGCRGRRRSADFVYINGLQKSLMSHVPGYQGQSLHGKTEKSDRGRFLNVFSYSMDDQSHHRRRLSRQKRNSLPLNDVSGGIDKSSLCGSPRLLHVSKTGSPDSAGGDNAEYQLNGNSTSSYATRLQEVKGKYQNENSVVQITVTSDTDQHTEEKRRRSADSISRRQKVDSWLSSLSLSMDRGVSRKTQLQVQNNDMSEAEPDIAATAPVGDTIDHSKERKISDSDCNKDVLSEPGSDEPALEKRQASDDPDQEVKGHVDENTKSSHKNTNNCSRSEPVKFSDPKCCSDTGTATDSTLEVAVTGRPGDGGIQYRLEFSGLHVQTTDSEQDKKTAMPVSEESEYVGKIARLYNGDSRRNSLDVGAIQEKSQRFDSEFTDKIQRKTSDKSLSEGVPERQKLFDFLRTPSLASRQMSLGLRIITDDLEWMNPKNEQCPTISPTSSTERKLADLLKTPSFSSKPSSRWSSYENISTPSQREVDGCHDNRFLRPNMFAGQGHLSHSASTVSLDNSVKDVVYNIDLGVEVKVKISDKPVKCLLRTWCNGQELVLSFSGSYGDDEAVLKWRKKDNELLWTNEPVLEFCPKTKLAKLPSYMRRRLSSSSSFKSHASSDSAQSQLTAPLPLDGRPGTNM